MADRIILACILVLAGVYFWATSQIPTLEIGDPLGPKAFPRLLGLGLLLTAAMLLAEIIKERKTVQSQKPADAPEEEGHSGVVAGATVATAIFFVCFEFVGYVLAVTLYLLVMMNYFNKNGRWMVNGLTAVIYGVSSYFIFTKALGVNLPHGLLPF